jgi:hypothetical protein
VTFGSSSRAVNRLPPAARSVGWGVAPRDRMVALVSLSREILRRMRRRRRSGGCPYWRARADGRSCRENSDRVALVKPMGGVAGRSRRSAEPCHLARAKICRRARPPATNCSPTRSPDVICLRSPTSPGRPPRRRTSRRLRATLSQHAIIHGLNFRSDYPVNIRIDTNIPLNCKSDKCDLVLVERLKLLNRKALHKV